jgi:hypothetical protein
MYKILSLNQLCNTSQLLLHQLIPMQKPYGFSQSSIVLSYQLNIAIPGQGQSRVVRKCSTGIKIF